MWENPAVTGKPPLELKERQLNVNLRSKAVRRVALGFLLQFLHRSLLLDCDLGHVSQIKPFIHKLFW